MIEGPTPKSKGVAYTPGRGTVKGVRINGDGEYQIDVQHGPDVSPSGSGNMPVGRWPCTSTVYVTADQASKIKVGAEVTITVVPVAKQRSVR